MTILVGVGGGKGGVGKSVVAANLSIAMAEVGMRTILVDLDLGAPNQHTLMGIDRPGPTLSAFLSKEVASLEEVVRPTGTARLFLVPGVGAIHGAANLPHAVKLKLLRHVRGLDADLVVMDVGAGVSFNVVDLWNANDLRVVVSSPQLTALQNAYCFVKAAVHRELRRRLDNHAQREAFEAACAHTETERIRDLRARTAALGAGLEDAFDQVTGGFATRIVGNMLERPDQRRVLAALSRMARDFLDVDLPVAAALPMSRAIHESVTRRRPFMIGHPDHEASRAMRTVAEALLSEDVEAVRARRTAVRSPRRIEVEPLGRGASLVEYLRRDDRVEVRFDASVRSDGGATVRARIVDLSARGLQVDGVAPLGAQLDDRLEITVLEVAGRPRLVGDVRNLSVSGDRAGIELHAESCDVAASLLKDAPDRPMSKVS